MLDAIVEARAAQGKYGRIASAHEGHAVLLEEVEELWEHVRKKPKDRDRHAMRRECMQIAAVAARIATELCETGKVNER